MKQKLLAVLIGAALGCTQTMAQTDNTHPYHNFPLIVTLQFHALSLPFRHLNFNMRNVGIGLGTEFSYNGKANGVQQISALWYRNKMVGNGLLLFTQATWRPDIGNDAFGELKLGAGYMLAARPTASFERINGKWISAKHKGKGMLTIPIGISAGRNFYSGGNTISPFVSYQFMAVTGYNKSVPVIPETLIQAGTRIDSN